MYRRSSEKSRAKQQQSMTQYYAVIGFFVVTMVFVVLYSVTNTKQTVGDRLIIDENLIMATNNVESSFKRQTNALFEVSLLPLF
jgi:CHASE3 domain sensor protein